jgi:hypothetical protein
MQEKIEPFFKIFPAAHRKFYENPHELRYFNGPTLHYHIESLNSRHCPVLFTKNSYAMLACWGMHRMGSKGPKMQEFSSYQKSINEIWPDIRDLQSHSLETLGLFEWEKFRRCFFKLNIMEGAIILIGHSKVLSHLLPNITPPIDRTYILKHLEIFLANGEKEKKQWEIYFNTLKNFFRPILQDDRFQKYLQCRSLQSHPWATSPLKCIDNLIIGAEKGKSKKPKNENQSKPQVGI